MKAIVLAGGYATRLWPITKHRPKMFLPVGDRTVIDKTFENLEEDDRVDEVFISTNERFAESFETYIDEHDFEKLTLSVEDSEAEGEKFGVVGALEQLVRRENVDDDLFVVAGDNLIGFHLSEFLDFFDEKGNAVLAAYDVGSKEKAKSYGLVTLDGDTVVDFQEKPEEPNSTLVSIACYCFPQESLPLLETYLDDGENPDEPGWFIQWLQQQETVSAFTFDDAWYDIGTAQSYLDAVAWALDGGNVVHESATVTDSELGSNVQIMAGATVENSVIDESVVFPNVTITNAEIKRSIIDEETSIDNLDFAGALIGAHTQIDGQ
ncbi:sugar phosphate nucleotidyltransferase [Natronocalculus amylovorans]|uniref:NDP-sugar synthase n=1 Tax=Natronocalculus amylovorans TaxID=2917812 RepID=A0AAE3FZV0_9EURY|nr:NDP-sugar synthase [Natronocalculus amylovorans]MCL9818437.1 NDP-sugar synthase [Natronocalculus amylovorans]